MIIYMGIDLGKKGAITVQRKLPGLKPKFEIYPFYQRHGEETRQRSLIEDEYYSLLQNICEQNGEIHCTIERPMFISKGLKAVASLHEHFGLMKGILLGMGVSSFWFPTPQQWKKVVNAPGSDKSVMLKKARSKVKHTKLNIETADSLLICEACRLYFQ